MGIFDKLVDKASKKMETDMNDTMCRLRTVTAEQERMEAELMIATQIQEGTLPRQFPAFELRHDGAFRREPMDAKLALEEGEDAIHGASL